MQTLSAESRKMMEKNVRKVLGGWNVCEQIKLARLRRDVDGKDTKNLRPFHPS